MKTRRVAAVLAAVLFLGPAAAVAQDARPGEAGRTRDFSFYGIHFRMTREQIRALMQLDDCDPSTG
jgi:hypothetical protein